MVGDAVLRGRCVGVGVGVEVGVVVDGEGCGERLGQWEGELDVRG